MSHCLLGAYHILFKHCVSCLIYKTCLVSSREGLDETEEPLATRSMLLPLNRVHSRTLPSLFNLLQISITSPALKTTGWPTKPWSFQIQYFSTDLETLVGRLRGRRCLIHGMKSMFRHIFIHVSLGEEYLSAFMVNKKRRLHRCVSAAGALTSLLLGNAIKWLIGVHTQGTLEGIPYMCGSYEVRKVRVIDCVCVSVNTVFCIYLSPGKLGDIYTI